MNWIKKTIIAVIIVTLVTGAAAGGLFYVKKMNQKEVMVVDVSSITGVYYSSNTTLDGQISTSVSQNITVDSDMIIDNVYVQKGSQVAVGDPLVTFDTTLVEMELNIAKLKKQKQEQDLTNAVNRLNSLKNGGPIDESDSSLSINNADNLTNSSSGSSSGNDEELTPVTSAKEKNSGAFLASIMQPFLLASMYDESLFGDGSSQGENMTDSAEDSIFDSGETENGNNAVPAPTPTPTPALDADTDYFDPYFTEGPAGTEDLHDGNPVFYTKLDGDSIPFTGTGTEEDPFVFFCGSAKGQVTVTGAFLNKMAGYDADGLNILKEGGYWYQLEFHQNDTVSDFSDRKLSCIGYYLIDGSMLEKPVDMLVETEFTIEGASQYDDDSGVDEYPDDGGSSGSGGTTATMTREEAIKLQQNKIASLKLDIEESDISIAKLEKKAQRKIVYSKLDGTVSYVGDTSTGTTDGNAFIVVQSKDGFYVRGSVSELMLDKIKEGMTLSCMSYSESSMGGFEAEIIDVADYPVSSSSYYYGSGNPNVSYYSFSAVVTDKSLKFSDMEYVTITLPSEELTDGSFVIQREFVRSEDGNNYVYKDDNGVLKKQLLSVGGNVNGGYYVLVKGGLSMDDKVAFPYGSDVKEGVKTKDATLEELYGY